MTAGPGSQMAREIAEVPDLVSQQLKRDFSTYWEAGARWRTLAPPVVVTNARGTSDHGANYFKYLTESRLGIPVASIGPSIGSLYQTPLRLSGAACLSISQSGASPDLIALQKLAKQGGAETLAVVNVADGPLGEQADQKLLIGAGPELAVAATKSYVGTLTALAAIHAGMADDRELADALLELPEALAVALTCDWSAAEVPIANASSLFTVSRGPLLALASEAALKFKETCRLHAEAYSGAEVQHGPIALAGDHFAALVFLPEDEARESVVTAARRMAEIGARVFVVGDKVDCGQHLACASAPHPLLSPMVMALSFYRFIERLASRLGENPDAPPNLRKVTETV